MRKKQSVTNNKGYTLIEVIITLVLVSVVFTVILSLFAKSMKYNTEGRYEIIAAGLAQEGVEIIKNKREKNLMDWALYAGPSPWPDPFVDITEGDIPNCNPSLDMVNSYSFDCNANVDMQYNIGQKSYTTSGGSGPVFTRRCNTRSVGSGQLQVTCAVSWDSLTIAAPRSVEAKILLTDWQQ